MTQSDDEDLEINLSDEEDSDEDLEICLDDEDDSDEDLEINLDEDDDEDEPEINTYEEIINVLYHGAPTPIENSAVFSQEEKEIIVNLGINYVKFVNPGGANLKEDFESLIETVRNSPKLVTLEPIWRPLIGITIVYVIVEKTHSDVNAENFSTNLVSFISQRLRRMENYSKDSDSKFPRFTTRVTESEYEGIKKMLDFFKRILLHDGKAISHIAVQCELEQMIVCLKNDIL